MIRRGDSNEWNCYNSFSWLPSLHEDEVKWMNELDEEEEVNEWGNSTRIIQQCLVGWLVGLFVSTESNESINRSSWNRIAIGIATVVATSKRSIRFFDWSIDCNPNEWLDPPVDSSIDSLIACQSFVGWSLSSLQEELDDVSNGYVADRLLAVIDDPSSAHFRVEEQSNRRVQTRPRRHRDRTRHRDGRRIRGNVYMPERSTLSQHWNEYWNWPFQCKQQIGRKEQVLYIGARNRANKFPIRVVDDCKSWQRFLVHQSDCTQHRRLPTNRHYTPLAEAQIVQSVGSEWFIRLQQRKFRLNPIANRQLS